MAAFRWSVDEGGLISVNPLARKGEARKKGPPIQYKQDKVAITDAEHAAFLAYAGRRQHKDFYYLLEFLYGTGARPAEMSLAKAKEWDEEKKAFVIEPILENQGRYKLLRLGDKRTIYIPDNLIPIARELMARHPTGPLFLTERGAPWTERSLGDRFDYMRKVITTAVVRAKLTSYSYRHAFVTRWVLAKKYIPDLCDLLQTSEQMIRKHYNHLFEQHETLRQALNEFSVGTRETLAISTAPAALPTSAAAALADPSA